MIFLNMHKKCNASFRYDRLETVRLSSVLSFGALMISEPVNAVDTEIFKVGEPTEIANLSFFFFFCGQLEVEVDLCDFCVWLCCICIIC